MKKSNKPISKMEVQVYTVIALERGQNGAILKINSTAKTAQQWNGQMDLKRGGRTVDATVWTVQQGNG